MNPNPVPRRERQNPPQTKRTIPHPSIINLFLPHVGLTIWTPVQVGSSDQEHEFVFRVIGFEPLDPLAGIDYAGFVEGYFALVVSLRFSGELAGDAHAFVSVGLGGTSAVSAPQSAKAKLWVSRPSDWTTRTGLRRNRP